jgi:hypothetical protein
MDKYRTCSINRTKPESPVSIKVNNLPEKTEINIPKTI